MTVDWVSNKISTPSNCEKNGGRKRQERVDALAFCGLFLPISAMIRSRLVHSFVLL